MAQRGNWMRSVRQSKRKHKLQFLKGLINYLTPSENIKLTAKASKAISIIEELNKTIEAAEDWHEENRE